MAETLKKLETEIVILFIKLLSNSGVAGKTPMINHLMYLASGPINDLDKYVENLENKVKLYCEKANQDDRKKIMLAHVFYLKIINRVLSPRLEPDLIQLMKTIEPFKNDSKGIDLYMEATKQLCLHYARQRQYTKAQKLADRLEEVYVEFIKSGQTEMLSFFDLCNVENASNTRNSLNELSLAIGFCVWEAYEESRDIEKQSKFAMRAMTHLLKSCHPSNFVMNLKMLNKLGDMLNVFRLKRRYKQLDHAIASTMAYLVQFRRDLPEKSRNVLNCVQGSLSIVYTEWGIDLIEAAIQKLTGKSNTKPIDNKTFAELEVSSIKGVEIYAGQFSIEGIKSENELNQALSRVKQWNKRALQINNMMASDFQDPLTYSICSNQYKENFQRAQKNRSQFQKLEEELKNVDLKNF